MSVGEMFYMPRYEAELCHYCKYISEARSYSRMDCRWLGGGATWRKAIRMRRIRLVARSYGTSRPETRCGAFNCNQLQTHT